MLLALSKAEAALALANYDARRLTRSFADSFRLRASSQSDGAIADLAWLIVTVQTCAARTSRSKRLSHATCKREPEAATKALASAAPSTPADRRILKVGPAIVEIEAGRYVSDVAVWTQNGLLLRGVNGLAHLDSRGRTANEQGIWVIRGNDIVVENIEFSGARSRTRNGSGIRFLGRSLTVRDSSFHHNEDGVLTWTSPDSKILIEHSVFAHNGAGDGQSHNIHIGNIRRFTLRFSHAHASISGHEVTSRARINHIEYNRLTDEGDGNSSYFVDIPRRRPCLCDRQRTGEGAARRES